MSQTTPVDPIDDSGFYPESFTVQFLNSQDGAFVSVASPSPFDDTTILQPVQFGGVTQVTSVPEPSTVLGLVLFGGYLGTARLRRKGFLKLPHSSRRDSFSENHRWKGQLDMSRIGAFGQSWGGYTVLALAGANIDYDHIHRLCNIEQRIIVLINPSVLLECTLDSYPLEKMDLRDPRIKAVFAANPLATAVAGFPGIGQIQIPTMILSASDDLFARPVAEQILPFNWLTTKDKHLILARNATHFTPLNDKESNSAFQLPDWMIGPPPAQMFRALNSLSVAFFKKYLEGTERYDGYLGQAYTQSLGEKPMRFSSITSLNDETKQALAAIFKKYTGITEK